jgi:hypothetical protein
MKKIKLLLLFLLFGHYSSAEDYRTIQKSDSQRNFVFSIIKDGDKEIAKFCLVNPEHFYFFSIESDRDLFPNIEKNIWLLSERKDRGFPVAAILVDFSNQIKIKRSFSLKYLLLKLASPYLRKVEIFSPKKISQRFLIGTEIEDKDYYGVMVINSHLDVNGAKKILRQITGVGKVWLITPILDDFPIKLVSFETGLPVTIYESNRNHSAYTCIFLAGTNK